MKLSPKAKASLDQVVERFKSGDLSPIVEIARIKLDPNAPASKWSFGNQVMAYIQTGSLDCRGFKQWREAGRQVQKGTRGAFILGPRLVTKDKGTSDERKALTGFVSISVHPVTNTKPIDETTPETETVYAPRELPPLSEVAAKLGVNVNYLPLPADRLGDYHPSADKINLGTDDVSVFFHELAHAAHGRLETLKGGQDARQETVAEFSACVLMHLYGQGDRSGNAWKYIKGYANEPIVAISKALATVEKILTLLTGEADASPVVA